MRAITGSVPDHRGLRLRPLKKPGRTGWPAPADAGRAIDDLEHDLASLKPLLDSHDPAAVKGHAHYLLGLNEALRRSVISRWARGRSAWSDSDGLVRVTPGVAQALERSRLGRRPYSLSALQRFAVCPYQFLLATIYRMKPWEEPEPLLRMDPLTRGSLFHKVQAEFFRELDRTRALPVTSESLPAALATLDRVLDRVSAEYAENLAPAIERVWRDEIADLRRDLGIWVWRLTDEHDWQPTFFEFSFGLHDEGRDPRSLKDQSRWTAFHPSRVGRPDRTPPRSGRAAHYGSQDRPQPFESDLIVDGGKALQPESCKRRDRTRIGKEGGVGPALYCTTVVEACRARHPDQRLHARSGLQVLSIVDRAVEDGFLAAVPAERRARGAISARSGPHEEERVKKRKRRIVSRISKR